jgi:hypothetical protein
MLQLMPLKQLLNVVNIISLSHLDIPSLYRILIIIIIIIIIYYKYTNIYIYIYIYIYPKIRYGTFFHLIFV